MRCCCKSSLACSSVVPTGAGDERRAGHEFGHRAFQVARADETNVSIRQDADQPAAAVRLGDGTAANAIAAPSAPRFLQRRRRRQCHR